MREQGGIEGRNVGRSFFTSRPKIKTVTFLDGRKNTGQMIRPSCFSIHTYHNKNNTRNHVRLSQMDKWTTGQLDKWTNGQMGRMK